MPIRNMVRGLYSKYIGDKLDYASVKRDEIIITIFRRNFFHASGV